MNIQKEFEKHYQANELLRDEEGYFCIMLDEELDPFTVRFNYDRCATINTEKETYIVLSRENLSMLDQLIDETEMLYSEEE